jgi:hypothetical protein
MAKDDVMDRRQTFERDLARLLNRHCMEMGSNTPDFVLAQFLNQCLVAFDCAVNQQVLGGGGGFDFDTYIRSVLEQAVAERKRWKGDSPVTGP